jgi:hypothetical protein
VFYTRKQRLNWSTAWKSSSHDWPCTADPCQLVYLATCTQPHIGFIVPAHMHFLSHQHPAPPSLVDALCISIRTDSSRSKDQVPSNKQDQVPPHST